MTSAFGGQRSIQLSYGRNFGTPPYAKRAKAATEGGAARGRPIAAWRHAGYLMTSVRKFRFKWSFLCGGRRAFANHQPSLFNHLL